MFAFCASNCSCWLNVVFFIFFAYFHRFYRTIVTDSLQLVTFSRHYITLAMEMRLIVQTLSYSIVIHHNFNLISISTHAMSVLCHSRIVCFTSTSFRVTIARWLRITNKQKRQKNVTIVGNFYGYGIDATTRNFCSVHTMDSIVNLTTDDVQCTVACDLAGATKN